MRGAHFYVYMRGAICVLSLLNYQDMEWKSELPRMGRPHSSLIICDGDELMAKLGTEAVHDTNPRKCKRNPKIHETRFRLHTFAVGVAQGLHVATDA